MLAQSFMSAADLGITEAQKDALIKTLVLLETGKLTHVTGIYKLKDFEANPVFAGAFNMNTWSVSFVGCGTVCCIGGTAELIGNVKFSDCEYTSAVHRLFYPYELGDDNWCSITTDQAARALRSFLSTGDAKWSEAVSA